MSGGTAPVLPGTRCELRRHSDDAMRPAQVMECAECGSDEAVFSSKSTSLPAAALASMFAKRGWRVSKKGKHVCPSCIEKEKPVSEPRIMELKDRRRIIAHLVDVYDDVNSRYCEGATDNEVAKALGVPRAWVQTLREENFGPSGRNVEMDRVAEAIGQMHANSQKLTDDAMAIAARGEELAKTAEGLRKRLDAIDAAVGPRAVRA